MIGVSLIDETSFETDKVIVRVGYVVSNSPAKKSGFKVNDIILKVGLIDVKSSSDVIDAISNNGINKTINISLRRGNRLIKLKVKPTDMSNLSNN